MSYFEKLIRLYKNKGVECHNFILKFFYNALPSSTHQMLYSIQRLVVTFRLFKFKDMQIKDEWFNLESVPKRQRRLISIADALYAICGKWKLRIIVSPLTKAIKDLIYKMQRPIGLWYLWQKHCQNGIKANQTKMVL